jgi:hypothetical protein
VIQFYRADTHFSILRHKHLGQRLHRQPQGSQIFVPPHLLSDISSISLTNSASTTFGLLFPRNRHLLPILSRCLLLSVCPPHYSGLIARTNCSLSTNTGDSFSSTPPASHHLSSSENYLNQLSHTEAHIIATMTEVATHQQVPLDTIPISPQEPHDGDSGAASSGGDGNEYSEQRPITVFHDSSNFNVKHPLMNTWTLWFTKPPTGKVHQLSYFPFIGCFSCAFSACCLHSSVTCFTRSPFNSGKYTSS